MERAGEVGREGKRGKVRGREESRGREGRGQAGVDTCLC